ncbi:MAG: hypothetical protein ACLFR1_04615 [Spirochaetia bacterium]
MNTQIQRYENIPIELPSKEIIKRLSSGKAGTKALPDRFSQIVNQAYSEISLSGVSRILEVDRIGEDKRLILENGVIFTGGHITRFLQDARYALLYSSFCTGSYYEKIKDFFNKGFSDYGVIYDAVAGELADRGMDFINTKERARLIRSGAAVSKKRFSPGYGDFVLEHQSIFYRLLKLSQYNIQLTDSYIFIPEKTVTAVSPIFT